MRLLKIFKSLLLNTLFPPVCVSCKNEGDFLCADCLKSLDKKKIHPTYRRTEKDPDFYYLDGLIYGLDYAKNPTIKAAIKQLKYKFTQDLAQHFSDIIAEKIGELNMVKDKKIILIPVPLHKKRLNYRGFNQAEIIARAVASQFSDDQIEVVELLERIRHTDQQAKLNKKERHKNLDGAFSIKFDCHPKLDSGSITLAGILDSRLRGNGKEKVEMKNKNTIYFIVDDVCTTGSTLEECAEVLKNNGIKKVYGLVIARAFK